MGMKNIEIKNHKTSNYSQVYASVVLFVKDL
jgi:hypothetical protein